jgi:cation diffusion facilitator family transporter
MVAAGGIIYTAVRDMIRGPELSQIGIGLWITGGLAAVNLVLGIALIRSGRKHNSIVLTSNGHHVLTDMWTSVGVIAGLFLVQWTGALWLDPAVAIAVALNILWTAYALMKRSVAGLMELADPDETTAIRGILDRAVDDGSITGYHELRHRRVYDRMWIEYHLIFGDDTSLVTSHDISHRIEDDIDHLFPKDEVIVTAHLEPESHEPRFDTRRADHERSPLPSREA